MVAQSSLEHTRRRVATRVAALYCCAAKPRPAEGRALSFASTTLCAATGLSRWASSSIAMLIIATPLPTATPW